MANLNISRRSGFVLRGGRQRRQTFWVGGTWVASALNPAGVQLVRSLNAAALALRPFTVIRTRGIFTAVSDQQAASEFQVANYGSIIVSEQAVAIGVTAVPTPVTDDQSNWHVFEQIFTSMVFASGVGVGYDGAVTQLIDSKAMRKVSEGQQLIDVLEVPSIGNAGVAMNTYNRILIKLH